MDINIIAGKCSEDNNRRIFQLLKNRDKTKPILLLHLIGRFLALNKGSLMNLMSRVFLTFLLCRLANFQKNFLVYKQIRIF